MYNYRRLKIYNISMFLILGLFIGSCASPESVKSTEELSTEYSNENFQIKDIYQNIQKGRTIASIYAVTTSLSDYSEMETYAAELTQPGEKYLIVYFLDMNDNTEQIEMKGVLLNPKLRPFCKAVYEKTPGEESFTELPFDS